MDLSKKFLKRVGMGKYVEKKSRKSRPRSRTSYTYQRKLAKLKNTYEKLKKKSAQFATNFPTFQDYAKYYPLKEASGGRESRSFTSEPTKKRGLWGM